MKAVFFIVAYIVAGSMAAVWAYEAAEPPAAPATIETACSPTGGVIVYWSDPVQAGWTGFRVWSGNRILATTGPEGRQYSDLTASAGTVSTYRVEALYPDGQAVASHTIFEKTPPPWKKKVKVDLIVASASSAGVAAAVTAARMGLHVALIEETDRLGGILSNGLCDSDIRHSSDSNGFFEEFRQAVQRYYGSGNGLSYEPHVVNNVLKQMVASEPGIDVYYHVRIVGVKRSGNRVTGVEARYLTTGKKTLFQAPMTIDADPSGDVAAMAGCAFRYGREPRSKEEPHAGVIYYWRQMNELLPGSTGKGDRRLMAYAYLLVVKDYGPGTNHVIPEPPGYRESDYIHSPAWKYSWAATSGVMPGNKYELNQHPEGNDLQVVNYRWAQAGPKKRAEIEMKYRDHALGYLYYLQNHDGMPNLGLPDDEFPSSGGFPTTLYVREARRIQGMTTLTESDVTDAAERLCPRSGGIGDYPMDSHAVRPKTDWNRPDMGEGEYWLYRQTPLYQVPIGVVIPAKQDGLLVAEAVSATHVGYGTLRMEPVRMQMGEICGVLAALCLRTHFQPRQLPPSMVQDYLSLEGQRIFAQEDVTAEAAYAPAVQFLCCHGFWPGHHFGPEDNVSRLEARDIISQLVYLEAIQSGDPSLELRLKNAHIPMVDRPQDPITRAEFARMLVESQSMLSRDWDLAFLNPDAPAIYPDLPAGSDVDLAAKILHRHCIDPGIWKGTPYTADKKMLFEPTWPIRRADVAETIFLCQRAFASPFLKPVEVIVKPTGPIPTSTAQAP